jgi:hypothetical protein
MGFDATCDSLGRRWRIESCYRNLRLTISAFVQLHSQLEGNSQLGNTTTSYPSPEPSISKEDQLSITRKLTRYQTSS